MVYYTIPIKTNNLIPRNLKNKYKDPSKTKSLLKSRAFMNM